MSEESSIELQNSKNMRPVTVQGSGGLRAPSEILGLRAHRV